MLAAFDERRAADIMREALARAGITVGGDAPWDMRINDPRVYQRVLRDGTLGVGESYTDGWWDCDALDQMIDKVVRARRPGRPRARAGCWALHAGAGAPVQPAGRARRSRSASVTTTSATISTRRCSAAA